MATAKRHELAAAEWQDRAVALAEARHLTGTITRLGRWTGGDGSRWQNFRVPSADRTGIYTVDWQDGADRPACHCTAGSYGNPCCHAGAVIHSERQRAAAIANPERIYDTWDKWGEW